ncbi:hypothetical protein BKA67DRAFT_638815 [Truncatella angustata]|uniref:DDX60-like winged helix domain-containing protein n=1 Tax=Truncatella angustata TaxID=152316 RepID=A0A9P8UDV6_9PEZI|nr:uncharacterized protein BKA67DRAFT_638815 [Truncatella angustata]KAH6648115.1 hypothetical protein BKA67DRAFT_638815 [Truncatella angustata]
MFVVAPTSARKTFISFYAMRKVLECDDDGVLVCVAPTKALVNQIAVEVQARYNKIFKQVGIPHDLGLEPRDCLKLWRAMVKHQTTLFPVPTHLSPADALPTVCRKVDTLTWEKDLKDRLQKWIAYGSSPYDNDVCELEQSFRDEIRELEYATKPAERPSSRAARLHDPFDLTETTLPLLCRLETHDALPAIIFNYDRHQCKKICRGLLEELQQAELTQEKSGAKWERTLERRDDVKTTKHQDGERRTKIHQDRDAAEDHTSALDLFDPAIPLHGYHFADYTKLQRSDLDDLVWKLSRYGINKWLIESLQRGIGAHHAGMNRSYMEVVEILFRKGFLRVVIATGTLALGTNMPWHFPITTTLVLRLFTLLHGSKNSRYAVSAVNGLQSQPRLDMGGPSFKDMTMHHLRFSIKYLRKQFLLSGNDVPLKFAGLKSYLYLTENLSFAFHALLKGGYFHELCNGIDKLEKNTVETLMLVMAHLFKRIYWCQADSEHQETDFKSSSSIVFLPPLPNNAANILREHNRQTLDICKTYVKAFIPQHIINEDRSLPFVHVRVPNALPIVKIRSPFVTLSGLGEDFESIHDLRQTLRDGVFLEEAVMEVPLNAWLLDFVKHGYVMTIERANCIHFSLILATIINILLNFMKLKEGTDLDMLDVMDDWKVRDDTEDENSKIFSTSLLEQPKLVTKKEAKIATSWEGVTDEEDDITRVERQRATHVARLEFEFNDALGGNKGKTEGLRNVLKSFQKLHAGFNANFKAIWA